MPKEVLIPGDLDARLSERDRPEVLRSAEEARKVGRAEL